MAARKGKQYRRGKGRLGKLLQFLCVVAVLAAMTVGATVFFQVEQIEVSGNQRYTQEEIVAVTGIRMGDNLFRMNKFAIQDHVKEEMPYIEDILIRRKLPSTITVAVEEWGAVAQVLPNPDWSAPETEQDGDAVLPVATEKSWLVSVGGKVLEEAAAEDTRMKISGLTGLDTREGVTLDVPEEEEQRLSTAVALLGELESRKMIGDVSRMDVGSTAVVLEYLGRYDVKLPLDGDFSYQMQLLLAAVAEREGALGNKITGTFDLTQKNFPAVYSPNRIS